MKTSKVLTFPTVLSIIEGVLVNLALTEVSEHFLSNNHSHSHMLLIPIERLINQHDSFRKAREAHINKHNG